MKVLTKQQLVKFLKSMDGDATNTSSTEFDIFCKLGNLLDIKEKRFDNNETISSESVELLAMQILDEYGVELEEKKSEASLNELCRIDLLKKMADMLGKRLVVTFEEREEVW